MGAREKFFCNARTESPKPLRDIALSVGPVGLDPTTRGKGPNWRVEAIAGSPDFPLFYWLSG